MLGKSIKKSFSSQKGQALLIVVLVMVVALTVALSVATRSITSFRNSSQQANSQEALSAAEAGVEQAIKTNNSIPITTIPNSNNTTYATTVTNINGLSFLLNAGNPISQDEGIDLWLSNYSTASAGMYQNPYNGNFTVYWGDSSGDCSNAAVEVVVISGPTSAPTSARYAFDPCKLRSASNGFQSISSIQGSVGGQTFYYQASINNISNGLVARIIPLYMNASMGVVGTVAFPSQGSIITSTGTSGNTQRKVNVFQGYPELPVEYFLYNLFSP
ncbi:MAG: hypothetical protein M1277_01000 [Patescibacteria group bacterium]|nr:hypothetical protein [Patescibacteria group bacterium]